MINVKDKPVNHKPVVGDFSHTLHWSTRIVSLYYRHFQLLSLVTVFLLLTTISFAAVYVAHSTSPNLQSSSLHTTTSKQPVKATQGSTSTSGPQQPTSSPSSHSSSSSSTQTQTSSKPSNGSASAGTTPYLQTTWAACTNGGQYKPLSDATAAALITHVPEIRKYNATPFSIKGVSYQATNDYVPTDTELAHFESAVNQYGQTAAQANPYLQFVDGRDTLSNPSTDDLIQWAAHKWGIPEDWLRAEYAFESYWNQFNDQGDQTNIAQAGFSQSQFPVISWVPGSSTDVYESLGITQVRWTPDNGNGIGSEPLRWKSTAFNIDFQAATVRFYYDNPNGARSTWGDTSYKPCQQWNSIGGWFNPYPWNNSGQAGYITNVQQYLSERIWTTPSFINFTPSVSSLVTFQ